MGSAFLSGFLDSWLSGFPDAGLLDAFTLQDVAVDCGKDVIEYPASSGYQQPEAVYE